MVICMERGANDLHVVQLTPLPPIISHSSKIQNVLPFWCRLTKVVMEKSPLNGFSISNCCFSLFWFSFLSTSQEIGWEEHLWNDLFCVKWNV